ncbi:IPT/TIG domain-containing protein [Flavobacterium sp. N3904]|uniref:IPT/TIG domain-containing protein n=1 Tax=Flavobacterium sp. N3904 TaxID=2986835 RepID=UPI00222441BF|nr:IPT/TIG domain-containing protein [Flavobacterium sp. N3904]
MKKLKIKYVLSFFMMASIFISLLSSCSNDDSNNTVGPLAIKSVSKAVEGTLTPTDIGYPANMYIIQGSGFIGVQKIYFNDVDTYFNPTLVTDSAIFVTIDIDTPYENASSELKVVTQNGTVTYHFVIAPPAPILKSYNPINAAAGDVVTIYGSFFLDPIVTFGTTPATIVSHTIEQIQVKVPAGANDTYPTVTTISGSATGNVAVGTAIYDDIFYGIDGVGGWGISNTNIENTVASEVAQGVKAIKVDITSWSGFQIDMWANGGHPVPANATGIRFQMKLKADAKVRVIVGGDWGHQVWFDITTEYATYVVKWSDLGLTGPPATIGSIVYGSDGTDTTFYIDNIGFAL